MNTAIFQSHTGFCSAQSKRGTNYAAMNTVSIFARHALCVCLFVLLVSISLPVLVLVPVSIIYILMLIVVGVIICRMNFIPGRTQR